MHKLHIRQETGEKERNVRITHENHAMVSMMWFERMCV